MDAPTALAYGLLNRVVDPEALEAATRSLAESIVAKSPLAVTTGKQMFYRQLEMGTEEAYGYAGETMVCNLDSEDAREGIDAFVAKRRPQWRGC
jgi:enoyl-CoA hydratase/carnithine racemase